MAITLPFGNPSAGFSDAFTRRGQAVQAAGGADAWNALSPAQREAVTLRAGIDPAGIDFTARTGAASLGDALRRVVNTVTGGAVDRVLGPQTRPVELPPDVPQFAPAPVSRGGLVGVGGAGSTGLALGAVGLLAGVVLVLLVRR